MWKRWFKRGDEPAPAEVELSRIRILFNHFRRILEQNNSVLEAMAAMERALGGEYIFDQAFLESSVRDISNQVHHVAYSLNALTNNRHVPLYDRFQAIRSTLETILSGGPGPRAGQPVLAFDDLGWELEPLAGIEAVCQAELRRHAGLAVADGFALTVAGTNVWRGLEPGFGLDRERVPAKEAIRAAVAAQAERLSGQGAELLSLRLVRVAPVDQAAALDQDPPEASVTADRVVAAVDGLLNGLSNGLPHRDGPMAVVVVPAEAAGGTVTGVVRTRDPESGRLDALRITAKAVSGPFSGDPGDRYLMRRAYPFDPVRSRIPPRSVNERFSDGKRAVSAVQDGLLRGSGLVDAHALRSLAEMAMSLERMLGVPAELSWSLDRNGNCLVSRPRPLLNLKPDEPGPDLLQEIEKAEVLARGGRPVQAGVAAGRVVHVSDDLPADQFPPGAVAVARSASPRLTPILQRAGAVVTEYGTPAGHLATVARELRLPAVFGMPDALRLLPGGTEITLDAAESVAYRGVLDGLLQSGWGAELYPTDPEYRTLRRLLRFIRPLNLTDPQSPEFTPQGCRTYHDIIHFCHESAVDELAHLQERRPGLGTIRTRPLKTGLPLPIRILDIGGGLAGTSPAGPGSETEIGDVRCEPLAAFLEGLRRPEAWDTAPADLRMRDVFAALPKTLGQLNAPASSLGENLAITSADYLNLSLRLGFHFSVVDAYLGPDPERSHVYFRFAGGLADPVRRARRVRLIRDVLEALDFSASLKDDLVVGSLKQVEPAVSRAALATLGALTAFVRQRDTAMRTDQDEERFYRDFEQAFLNRGPDTPPDPQE